MSNNLLSLPSRLLALIVGDWLEVTGAVRLDTAVCDSTTRNTLAAAIFSSTDCAVNQMNSEKNTDSLVSWSNKRKVRIGTVIYNKASDVAIYEDYFVEFGDTIKKVRSTEQTKSQTKANIAFINLIATHCRQIEVLELEGHALNAGLRDVLTHCAKLHTLTVSNPDKFNPQCLAGLQCPHIRTLSLYDSKSAETTAAFLKIAPNAHSVSVHECELQLSTHGSALQCLSPFVQTIYLNSVAISDSKLISMVDLCPCINTLHFKDIEFDNEKESNMLSIKGVKHLAQQCTHLSTISLTHCNLTEECLHVLVSHRAPKLTSLSIVECCELSTIGLNTALNLCPQLTHFHTRLEWNHSDLNFALLANVTTLHLELRSSENCRKFLAGVSLHCTKLQHLSVEITDRPDPTAQLNRIVRNCTDIRTLTMHVRQYEEEPLVSKEKIKEWQTMRPRLVVNYTAKSLDS